MCNESSSDTFQALYEVQLRCGGAALLFAGASLLEEYPNTNINTLVLTVRPLDTSGSGRVCTYSMSDINDAMDDGLTACRSNNKNREVAWDDFPSNFVTICDSSTITVSHAINFISCNYIVHFP